MSHRGNTQGCSLVERKCVRKRFWKWIKLFSVSARRSQSSRTSRAGRWLCTLLVETTSQNGEKIKQSDNKVPQHKIYTFMDSFVNLKLPPVNFRRFLKLFFNPNFFVALHQMDWFQWQTMISSGRGSWESPPNVNSRRFVIGLVGLVGDWWKFDLSPIAKMHFRTFLSCFPLNRGVQGRQCHGFERVGKVLIQLGEFHLKDATNQRLLWTKLAESKQSKGQPMPSASKADPTWKKPWNLRGGHQLCWKVQFSVALLAYRR